jgi:4-amino-4-deoxy-L-arabinose transferase-like glycosyltransferase
VDDWVAVAAAMQFCALLGRAHVTTSHEGRVAVTAREMAAGGDWIVPQLPISPAMPSCASD